jgi:hypothetical protein
MEVDISGTGISQLINFIVVVNITGVTGSINTLLQVSYFVIDELQLDSITPRFFLVVTKFFVVCKQVNFYLWTLTTY